MTYTAQEIASSGYKYLPNLTGNSIGLALVSLEFIVQSGLGIYFKQWWFLCTWDIGIGLLMSGYALRLHSRTNLYDAQAYQAQYSVFIFAPVFIMAGVYNQLSRLIRVYGTQFAHFKPKFYTIFFICCDVVSLLMQGAGGGLSAGGASGQYQTGINIIIAGIAFQCFSMVCFLFCLLSFAWKISKASPMEFEPRFSNVRNTRHFRLFIPAVLGCWVFVMVRSIYRLVELGEGWGGPLMSKEVPFFILEGLMMILAIACLTIVYPGFFFDARKFNKFQMEYYPDDLSEKTLTY